MKKLMILLTLLGLTVAACSSPAATTSAPAKPVKAASENALPTNAIPPNETSANAAAANVAPASAAPIATDLTQTNDEAMVSIAVTPLNLEVPSAATLDFEIALNTHSVDLGYDLTQIATLSNTSGEQVQPTKWDGPDGGGHHRSGTLSFPPLKRRGQTLTLTLRGIADVAERTFTWKVN